jgi:hypothetical protein
MASLLGEFLRQSPAAMPIDKRNGKAFPYLDELPGVRH